MDKRTLKETLTSLRGREGIELQATLRGQTSETFTLTRVFVGKGKNGSMNAVLRAANGSEITIGTPKNSQVINMTIDGNMVGSLVEEVEALAYPRNEERGDAFKAQFMTLANADSIGKRVKITSNLDPTNLNGTYVCLAQAVDPRNPSKGQTAGRLERGRFGQVRLMLRNEATGKELEVRSHRHSVAIDTFEILS